MGSWPQWPSNEIHRPFQRNECELKYLISGLRDDKFRILDAVDSAFKPVENNRTLFIISWWNVPVGVIYFYYLLSKVNGGTAGVTWPVVRSRTRSRDCWRPMCWLNRCWIWKFLSDRLIIPFISKQSQPNEFLGRFSAFLDHYRRLLGNSKQLSIGFQRDLHRFKDSEARLEMIFNYNYKKKTKFNWSRKPSRKSTNRRRPRRRITVVTMRIWTAMID